MKGCSELYHAFFGLVACLAIFLISILSEPQDKQTSLTKIKAAIGSKEDPEARAEYEWMRLRDPATGKIPKNIRKKELMYAASLPTKESRTVLEKNNNALSSQVLKWDRRGPFNIGGRTRALAIDVSNENIILAGGVSGGIWRSTNSGNSWIKTTAPTQIHSVTAIAQDTRDGNTNIWYAGTGEKVGDSANGGGAPFLGDGIFKSTDGGRSWTLLSSTSSGQPQFFNNFFDFVWNIATDASNSEHAEVYAATHNTIRRSIDGGVTWDVVLGNRSLFTYFADVAVTTTGVVYATLNSGGDVKGIWRSYDGQNWTDITPLGWPGGYNRIVIGIAPSNENVVYFLAETRGSGALDHNLWQYTNVSDDGSGAGGSWVDRTANIPSFGGAVGDYDSQRSYNMLIKVRPDDEDIVFVGGTNLYRSTDGFATTNSTTWIGGYANANDVSMYPNHHPDQHALAFLPSDPNMVISAHDGGLSKTTNILASGVSWSSLNNGYFTTQFYSLAVDHATPDDHVIIGGMQDNGTWFTNSASSLAPWTELSTGDGAFCAIAAGRSSYYVSSQLGTTFRLLVDENGKVAQWTNITPAGAYGFLFISPFVLDPNNTNMMYFVGGDRVWRNSDLCSIPLSSKYKASVNWTELRTTIVLDSWITAIAASTTPPNRVYYGTNNSQLYRLDGADTGSPTPIYLSRENEEFPFSAYISSIAIDPTNADRAILAFSNYNVRSLFYTTDAGMSWSNVSGNLEEFIDGKGNGPSTRWASIIPGSASTHYFVGTSTGLYSTTTLDGISTTWVQEGATTIGNVVVEMIDFRSSDGFVAVATHGQGIFSSNLGNHIPAELTSFTGKFFDNSFEVKLRWTTATELNNLGFEVQRKSNVGDTNWVKVGFEPGSGTTTLAQNYTYSDSVKSLIVSGIQNVAYRLKQISINGDFAYSDEIDIAIDIDWVVLTSFSARLLDESFDVELKWDTAREFNNLGFEVERKTAVEGSSWVDVGFKKGSDQAGVGQNYTYMDNVKSLIVSGIRNVSYRLKQIAINGDFEYIDEIEVDLHSQLENFVLHQNFPNPFNPSTKISYVLPFTAKVTLEIYNTKGQKIETLINEVQDANYYEIEWRSSQSGVASGVYFFRLQAVSNEKPSNRLVQVKRMVMMK